MKKKNVLFIFSLILFVCVSGCDVLNPVIDPWWEGGNVPQNISGDLDSGYEFKKEAYVVSFDSGGGNYVDSINGNSPSASPQRVWAHAYASVPGLVARGDDFFYGWYSAQTSGTKWDFATMPVDKDMTLYAHWVGSGGAGHTVDFDINFLESPFDAEANLTYVPLQEKIAYGAMAAEPLQFGLKHNSPYVNTHVFMGWYIDTDGNGTLESTEITKWNFATMPVTADMTLYGKWVKDEPICTVTFVSDADKNPPPNQYVRSGEKAIAPYVTYRSDYAFGGWYKDAVWTQAWDFATAVTTDITLYAKWAPVDPVDVLKDVDIVDFRYILFSGGQTAYNAAAAPGSSTNLTTNDKANNDDQITAIAKWLNDNPHYRVMIVGHANPATEADRADPMNPELVMLSAGRAYAVEAKLKAELTNYDYAKTTPIKVRAEGGRRAMNNPMLSRRVEIIVFDIITETVTP